MKRRLLYIISLLVSVMINIWIIIHRNDGFRYYPYKTYSQLYVDDSMLYLKDLEIKGSTATVKFSLLLSAPGYDFSSDFTYKSTIVKPNKNEISFPLARGIHTYNLKPADSTKQTISIQIDHSDKDNEFISCNLPGPQIKVSKTATWSIPLNDFSKEEKDSAVQILRKHTSVFDQHTDLEKAIALSKFVASLPTNPKGIPQGKLSEFRPLYQLHESLKCNAELACGNYTAIYYYLASNAGLKTRIITFRGGEPTWSYGIHYYNEVFLKEQQQWTLADPLYNVYFPHDEQGRFYNAADLKKMVSVNGFAGKTVYTFRKDSALLVPYDSLKNDHIYYHSSNADMCYLHPGIKMQPSAFKTFLDFYTIQKDFSYYSDTKSNDWGKIIIKYAALLSVILTAFCYLIFELRQRRKAN